MLGKGNKAEVFEYEHGKVCKLFFEGYPQSYVEHEFKPKLRHDKIQTI